MTDEQATPSTGGGDDDRGAAGASSSTLPASIAPVLESNGGGSPRQADGAARNDVRVDDDDDDEEEDGGLEGEEGDNRKALLSSFVRKSVRMGPFSIRYNDASSPRAARPSRSYEGPPGPDDDDDGFHYEVDEFRHRRRSNHGGFALRALRSAEECCRTHLLPPRILLLALYLAFTLSSFWILDSIKEPTLAILVDGELGRHQPRAKMVSFVVVVGMAVGMEWANRTRRARRRTAISRRGQRMEGAEEYGYLNGVNAALEKSWADRNLPRSMRDEEGGNGWRKMRIKTSRFWKHFHWGGRDGDDEDEAGNTSSKIRTPAFYIVGSLYIHFFVVVALALRQHTSFRPKDLTDYEATHPSIDEPHEGWYYPALGYALFALIESYGSVSITVFWAFANSHLTLESAERHYGSIVAVAQAGAIGGSTLSAFLGRRKEEDGAIHEEEGGAGDVGGRGDARVTPLLIFWACGCIGCGMAIMALYARLFSRPMEPSAVARGDAEDGIQTRMGEDSDPRKLRSKPGQHDDGGGGSSSSGDGDTFRDLFGGVHMIFRHEYLQLVLAVSVLYEIALTCMHYEMNLIGLDRFGVGISIVDESDFNEGQDYISDRINDKNHRKSGSDEGITYIQFMGWYGQTVNVLSLFLSFYAFPRLIKHYGLAFTIRIFPTFLLVVTVSAFVIFPGNLYFLFVSLSLCKALTYSVHDPSEEVLYMPTSDDAKFRAKFWIDVVGQRIAKAAGSAVNNYAGSAEGIVKYGSFPSVVASLGLWLACYRVGVVFDGLIKGGGVVGLKEEEGEEGLELCEGVVEVNEDGDVEDAKIIPTTSEMRNSIVEMTHL